MKVVVAGTFDILHPGHLYLFDAAAALGDLYVIIARDNNIPQTKKKVFTETERLNIIKRLDMVKTALLGDKTDFFEPIEAIQPDIIFLGPDQDESWVRSEIKKRNLSIVVKRLPERLPYSSTEIKKRICDPD
ncbi:MAG: adenylyltransferase/cytidyltransferase family protein [Theionarchaea archaeon]|nr:adenylyltransferase/cytidyltransferase family protein [Theionarchaea archaeon]